VFVVWKNGIFGVVPTFLSLIFLILFQVPFLLFLSLLELPSPLLFSEFLVFQLCLSILRWYFPTLGGPTTLSRSESEQREFLLPTNHKKVALQTALRDLLLLFAQYDGIQYSTVGGILRTSASDPLPYLPPWQEWSLGIFLPVRLRRPSNHRRRHGAQEDQ
jgi:hypothetical protein